MIAPRRLLLLPLLLAALSLPAISLAAPQRIFSLNLCADQLILALADRTAIASVTWLATDCAISVQCAAAAGLPPNHGAAEELYADTPDLVVAGRYTSRPAVAVARRRGWPVLELEVPRDLDGIRTQIATVAAAIGHPGRGAAMIAAFDARIAAVPQAPADRPRPVAAIYQANGFTVAGGSLVDRLLARAGFDNLAVRMGIDGYPFLPLESLIAGHPDLLILDDPRGVRPSLAEATLRHPILANLLAPERRGIVPQRLWNCGGPSTAEALERLAALRQQIDGTRP